MNSQVKEKWIAALRSGEYEQGKNKLRGSEGFCCLGVLCDLYSQEPFTKGWDFIGYNEYSEEESAGPFDQWYFDGESEFLPKSVMEWAELESNCPEVNVNDDADEGDYDSIANLNDIGYNFTILSNIIEEQL